MPDEASGTGAAHDATVVAVSNVGKLEAALAEARAEEEKQAPQRRLDAAKHAVAKAEQHLAWAKEGLRQAQADNRAEKSEGTD